MTSRWIAWSLLLASLAMVAFSFASLVLPGAEALPERPDLGTFAVVAFAFLALLTVGVVLAIRRPRNPIGWLFLVCGTAFTLSIFNVEYVLRATILGADLPLVVLVDWMGSWANLVAITLAATLIPLLFPDGRLPGPRWRPVALMAGGLVILGAASQAIVPDAPSYAGRLPNPVAIRGTIGEAATALTGVLFPALTLVGALSLTSLLVRFRRSRGIERQQLKWFLFAGCFFLLAAAAAFITTLELAWYGVIAGMAALPIAAGVAVLRYRLYEIDRIVSRTIGYGVVTALLVGLFAVLVVGLQAVLQPVTGRDTIPVALSTLGVAALFQPLRSRVQAIVDRRFNRARADAERTVASFAERLRDEVDLASLTADLDSTVRRTLAPSDLRVWLRGSTR